MAASTHLTHLLAARLEPGERELSDEDLCLIYDLEEVTDQIREEIAEDLRGADVEVLSSEPLRVRKAPPAPPEPVAAAPRSRRPWLIGVGIAALVALAVVLAPSPQASRSVTPRPLTPRASTTATHGARPRPQHGTPKRTIHAVEIARPHKRAAELPCEGRLRSKCEPRARAERRARRGR